MTERFSRTFPGDAAFGGAAGFEQILLESGLVSSEGIEAAQRALGGAPTDDELAQRLLQTGRLTAYQIKLLRAHKLSELVIGAYEVLDRLGAGGMGAVFKARHRQMKRVVALKVLASHLAGNEDFVQRFQREVEVIAQLTHPNIVMAFDAGVSEAGHFLVMEFVDGRDLDSVVTRHGPLSVSAAVHCVVQAARGLEYAHGRGIVHRDIKPANLLRDAQAVVKVTDLGLARIRNTVSGLGGLTQAGRMMGTVDFMPPEQAIDAAQTDQRADVYSLGATLYFLVTGQPPYPEQSLTAALLKHRDAPIPSLAAARKDVPAALDAIFRRMMAKSPEDRYQTMTEVVGALEAIQPTLSDTAGAKGTGAVTSPGPPPSQAATIACSALDPNLDTSLVAASDATDRTILERPAKIAGARVLKVILVEPSRVQSGIIRRYLQGDGINQVVAVASGKDALNALRTENPDAVICALHLPDMTGVQLAQQIRAENAAALPGFVLISSEADSAEAGSLSKYDKGVVLRKPFTPEKLAEALRVVADKPVADMSSAAGAKGRLGNLRVLIVDDSAPARMHIRGVLQGLDLAHFVEAADGAQAVAALAKDTFDLIVTDYNMPFMDGRGLVGYVKQNPATASVPIIMVTTETDPAKLAAVRQMGVTVCDKSFQRDVVRDIIEQIARVA
jgi:serine/threonine protein kinase/DNA-binding response OmpR family regulator